MNAPRPSEHAVAQPDHAGRWWFQGVARSGLTLDRVQYRPVLVDDDLTPCDPITGAPIAAKLSGWWVEEEKMGP